MSLLATAGLSVSIGGQSICRDLNFSLVQGQHWGILGGNGVGKTTLMQSLAGLHPVDGGEILIQGKPLGLYRRRDLARKLGVLFQDSQDTFPGTVMETALIGRHPWLPLWSFEGREDFSVARAALRDVAMETMAHRQVNTLSGGERRRLAIASLLVQNPRIWLLDEPTNHLDLKHQIRLLELLLRRADAAGGGLIMVLHDVNLITRFCSHVILMLEENRVICGPTAEVVNLENLQQLYQYPIRQVEADGSRFFYPA